MGSREDTNLAVPLFLSFPWQGDELKKKKKKEAAFCRGANTRLQLLAAILSICVHENNKVGVKIRSKEMLKAVEL